MKTDADLEALIATLTEHYTAMLTDPVPGKRLHARSLDVVTSFERWLHGIDADEEVTVDDVINVTASIAVTMLARIIGPVTMSDPSIRRDDLIEQITEVIRTVLLHPQDMDPDTGTVTFLSARAN